MTKRKLERAKRRIIKRQKQIGLMVGVPEHFRRYDEAIRKANPLISVDRDGYRPGEGYRKLRFMTRKELLACSRWDCLSLFGWAVQDLRRIFRRSNYYPRTADWNCCVSHVCYGISILLKGRRQATMENNRGGWFCRLFWLRVPDANTANILCRMPAPVWFAGCFGTKA